MKTVKTSSYFEFLKQSNNRHEKNPEVADLIMQFNEETFSTDFFPSIFYLSDYIKNTNYYRIFDLKNFLDYNTDILEKSDILFLNRIRNQEDMQIFNEQIFPDQMAFLANHQHEKNVKYTFTTNFRLRNFNNTWSYVVQRTRYLFNNLYKMPVASINSLTDLSYFKSDSKISHLIEMNDGSNGKTVLESRCYFDKNTKDILSKREVDVLKLASQGMGSKQIADQLNISVHTINNHRRNMLVRSNCKNFLQLVDIATKNGVI